MVSYRSRVNFWLAQPASSPAVTTDNNNTDRLLMVVSVILRW